MTTLFQYLSKSKYLPFVLIGICAIIASNTLIPKDTFGISAQGTHEASTPQLHNLSTQAKYATQEPMMPSHRARKSE